MVLIRQYSSGLHKTFVFWKASWQGLDHKTVPIIAHNVVATCLLRATFAHLQILCSYIHTSAAACLPSHLDGRIGLELRRTNLLRSSTWDRLQQAVASWHHSFSKQLFNFGRRTVFLDGWTGWGRSNVGNRIPAGPFGSNTTFLSPTLLWQEKEFPPAWSGGRSSNSIETWFPQILCHCACTVLQQLGCGAKLRMCEQRFKIPKRMKLHNLHNFNKPGLQAMQIFRRLRLDYSCVGFYPALVPPKVKRPAFC